MDPRRDRFQQDRGIVAVLPAAESSVFIVPACGLPWHWHAGEITRLAAAPGVGASVRPAEHSPTRDRP